MFLTLKRPNANKHAYNIREYLFNNFDKADVNLGQDLEIRGEGIFIEITTPQNQILNEINSNKTTINIEACENV